jgi:U3 small nucleolar RNA-associated protein 10
VASVHKNRKNVAQEASKLLLSFTAAFEHIPLNRRLTLFTHVANALGPQDCLHAIAAMVFNQYPTDNRAKRFVTDLLNAFDPSTTLIVWPLDIWY